MACEHADLMGYLRGIKCALHHKTPGREACSRGRGTAICAARESGWAERCGTAAPQVSGARAHAAAPRFSTGGGEALHVNVTVFDCRGVLPCVLVTFSPITPSPSMW